MGCRLQSSNKHLLNTTLLQSSCHILVTFTDELHEGKGVREEVFVEAPLRRGK